MRTLIHACLAVLLAAAAGAQTATAKLYTKSAKLDTESEIGKVLVAIQVTPELGAWVYDDDADSGGNPTEVTFGPAHWTWSKAFFPEPTRKEDPIVGEAKVHKQKFVIYGVGSGEGAEPSAVTVALKGLACNERTCMPWSVASVENRGPGAGAIAEAIWGGFPAALLEAPAPAEASVPAEASMADESAGASTAGAATDDDWRPDLSGDDKVAARAFARVDGETVTVVIEPAVAQKFHIYHGPEQKDVGPGVGSPTVPKVEGGNVEWGDWTFPEPHGYDPGFGGLTYVHEGRVVLRIKGEAFDEFDAEAVELSLTGQVCDDRGCIPFELEISLDDSQGPDTLFATTAIVDTPPVDEVVGASGAGVTDGVVLTPVEAPDASTEGTDGQAKDDGLLQFLLLAFGAGLITLLMPCTYPMIPITISFFTKQATARGGNVLGLALAYGAGIVLIFVLIGVIVGPAIVPFAQGWPLNLAIGVLFVVFGLSLFGMINLQPPAFLMNAVGKARDQGGYLGVFLMGACLVVTSFTCTAPFVGTLLGAGAGADGASVVRIALGMGVFGLTMATPFVFLALVPGRLPQAGGWMETLKVFMGFVELAAALKFFSNADLVLSSGKYAENGGLLSRELFLMTWAAIFVVAGLYLFGRINLKGENSDGTVGPGRLVGGIGSFCFAGFCLIGVFGYQYGPIMSAMPPPPSYSRGLVPLFQGRGGGDAIEAPTVIEDDYDKAVGVAIEQQRLLLINFTGLS